MIVVVDAANVIGSRPDGWWRDRAGAALRLYGDLSRIAHCAAGPGGYLLVLEGAARRAAIPSSALLDSDTLTVASGSVRVLLAPGSGDDAIVDVVHRLSGSCLVVTADRELRRRCAAWGAATVGPGWLLDRFRAE